MWILRIIFILIATFKQLIYVINSQTHIVALKAKNKAALEAEKREAIEEDECKVILKEGLEKRQPSPMIVRVTRSRSADYSIIENSAPDSPPLVKRAIIPLPSNLTHALQKASSQFTNGHNDFTGATKSKSDIEVLYHMKKGICKSADYNPNNNAMSHKRASSYTAQAAPRNCKSAEPILIRFTHQDQQQKSTEKQRIQNSEIPASLRIMERREIVAEPKILLDNTTQTFVHQAAILEDNATRFDCESLLPTRLKCNNTPRGDTYQHIQECSQGEGTNQIPMINHESPMKPSVLQCMLDKIEEGRMSRGNVMIETYETPQEYCNNLNRNEDEESRFQQSELKSAPPHPVNSRAHTRGNPILGYDNADRKDTLAFEMESPRRPVLLWNRPVVKAGPIDLNNNNMGHATTLPVPSYMQRWKNRLASARYPPVCNNCLKTPIQQTDVTTKRPYNQSSKWQGNGHFIPIHLPPLPEPYIDQLIPENPVVTDIAPKAPTPYLKPPKGFETSPRIKSQVSKRTPTPPVAESKHIVTQRRNKMYHGKNLPPPPPEVVPTNSEINTMTSPVTYEPNRQLSFTLCSPQANMIVVNDQNNNQVGGQLARPGTTSYLPTPIHIVVHHHHPEPQLQIQTSGEQGNHTEYNTFHVERQAVANSRHMSALPPTWNSVNQRPNQNVHPSVTTTNEVIHIEKNWQQRHHEGPSIRNKEVTKMIDSAPFQDTNPCMGSSTKKRYFKYKKVEQKMPNSGICEQSANYGKSDAHLEDVNNNNKFDGYAWLPPPSPLVNKCRSKWQFFPQSEFKDDCFKFCGPQISQEGTNVSENSSCFQQSIVSNGSSNVQCNPRRLRTTQHVYRKVRKCRKS